MDAAKPSRTARGVAFRRACHQLYDAPPLVFHDPIAVPLLGPEALPELHAAKSEQLNDPGNLILRAWLVARSRYAEDKLAEAVSPASAPPAAQPVAQYVLLGAGLDTFAHRNPHPHLRVFEVDHPATQAWKQQLVAAANLPAQPHLTYVPVNFETQSLSERLTASGFNPEAPAFFAMLGVVPYLTLPAFRATIAYIAARPTGTGLVFDYSQPLSVLPARERIAREAFAARVARAGEPFQLHLTPPEAARQLSGFFNLEDLGVPELNALYFDQRPEISGQPRLRLYGQSARILSAWL